ncbi:MAG: class I SAM-dependent methyltransferase [Candidatus Hodarchaeales archaeon]
MNPTRNGNEPSFVDQLKKFAIKSMLGFQTVIVFGLGRRLGIFDYLLEKAKRSPEPDDVSSVIFTPSELSRELNLDSNYLDGLLHMATECGIFEIDDSCERCLRTAPHVYYLLVDRLNMFYIGNVIGGFYYMAPLQEEYLAGFKTGQILNLLDLPEEIWKDAQRMSAGTGSIVERVFAEHCDKYRKILKDGGALLEVGCGFGYNLKNWAVKYPTTKMVGIDIDSRAIESAKSTFSHNRWKNQIEIICISISDYARSHVQEFDVILLNQVLHELDTDDDYRQKFFIDLHTLLKDDGLLVVGEHMIPGIFAPKQARYFEIMHKWFEVGAGSKFYDERSFKDFIDSTPFTKAKLVREDRDYFWAIKK